VAVVAPSGGTMQLFIACRSTAPLCDGVTVRSSGHQA
jgi:hypothetical protein